MMEKLIKELEELQGALVAQGFPVGAITIGSVLVELQGKDRDHLLFVDIIEALGWQGGTRAQVLAEIRRLKALDR